MADRQPNTPTGAASDPTVRVRVTADREIGEGDKKRTVKAGTAVRMTADEARSLVESGGGYFATYGQADATHGDSEDAHALQTKSRENEAAARGETAARNATAADRAASRRARSGG